MAADNFPPEKDVKDFRFQQLCKVRVFDSPEEILQRRVHLIVASSTYGLTFVATLKGFKVLQTSQFLDQDVLHKSDRLTHIITDFPLQAEVDMGYEVTHLALSCDDLTLAVGVTDSSNTLLYMYDIRNFESKVSGNVGPFMKVNLGPGDQQLQDLAWNPVLPSLLVTCMSSGKLDMFDITNNLTVKASNASAKALCVCWSPKGKQLVVGQSDGTLVQYDPDLKAKRQWEYPSVLQDDTYQAFNILWLSTYSFLVAYISNHADCSIQPNIILINGSKDGPTTYVNFEDVCYGTGEERQRVYYFNFLHKWEIVLAGSSNASEIGIIGRHLSDKQDWERWNLDDSTRAECPLTPEYVDTFPMGFTVDFSSQIPIPLGDEKVHPPSPLLLVLSTDGVIIPFHMIYTHSEAAKITAPVQRLNTAGIRKAEGLAPPKPAVTQNAAKNLFGQPTNSNSQPTSTPSFGAGQSSSTSQSVTKPMFGVGSTSATSQPGAGQSSISSSQSAAKPLFGGMALGSNSGTGSFSFGASTTPSSSLGTLSASTSGTSAFPSLDSNTGSSNLVKTPSVTNVKDAVGEVNPLAVASTAATSSSASSGFSFSTGSSTPQFAGFGSSATTTAAPLFGATTSNPPLFGATSSASPFGLNNSSTPAFGAKTSFAPTFGASTTSAPTFGANTSSAPAFGANTSSAPAFGANTSSAPAFGGNTSNAPTFGGRTSNAPTFGTSSTSAPIFGASSTPTFGATSSATPLFGATTTNSGPPTLGSLSTINSSSTSGSGSKLGSGPPAMATPAASTTASKPVLPAFGALTAASTLPPTTGAPTTVASASSTSGFTAAPTTGTSGATFGGQYKAPATTAAAAQQAPAAAAAATGGKTDVSSMRRPNSPQEVLPAYSTSLEPSAMVDCTFTKSIMDEIQHFSRELSESRTRCDQSDCQIGTNEDMKMLRTQTQDLELFSLAIKKSLQEQNKDVQDVSSMCLDMFAMAEDCHSRERQNKDPRYHHLLKNCALHPSSAQKLSDLRIQYQVLDQGLRDVDLVLDTQWEDYQNRKHNKAKRLLTPTNDAVYRAVKSHHNVILAQKSKLQELEERLKQLKLYNRTNTWQNLNSTTELSSLADSLVSSSPVKGSRSFGEPGGYQSEGLSAARSNRSSRSDNNNRLIQLRKHLERTCFPVLRSTKPENLSMSRLVVPDGTPKPASSDETLIKGIATKSSTSDSQASLSQPQAAPQLRRPVQQAVHKASGPPKTGSVIGNLLGTQSGTTFGSQPGTVSNSQPGTVSNSKPGELFGSNKMSSSGSNSAPTFSTQPGTPSFSKPASGTQQASSSGPQSGTMFGTQGGKQPSETQPKFGSQQLGKQTISQPGSMTGSTPGFSGLNTGNANINSKGKQEPVSTATATGAPTVPTNPVVSKPVQPPVAKATLMNAAQYEDITPSGSENDVGETEEEEEEYDEEEEDESGEEYPGSGMTSTPLAVPKAGSKSLPGESIIRNDGTTTAAATTPVSRKLFASSGTKTPEDEFKHGIEESSGGPSQFSLGASASSGPGSTQGFSFGAAAASTTKSSGVATSTKTESGSSFSFGTGSSKVPLFGSSGSTPAPSSGAAAQTTVHLGDGSSLSSSGTLKPGNGLFGQPTTTVMSSLSAATTATSATTAKTDSTTITSSTGSTLGSLLGGSEKSASSGSLFGQAPSGISAPSGSGSAGGLFGQQSSTASTAGLFGQSSTNSTTAAATAPSSGLFGQKPTVSTTATTVEASTSSSGGFFGQPLIPGTGSFGSASTGGSSLSSGGLFGSSLSSTTSSSGFFGQSTATATATSATTGVSGGLFGSSTAATTTTNSPSLFGQPKSTSASSGGQFGQSNTTSSSGGLFGQSGSASMTSGSAPLFGQSSSSGSSGGFFGQSATSSAGQATTTASIGLFGSSGSTPSSSGGGLFGKPATTSSGTPGLFGQGASSTPSSGGLFGQSSTSTPSSGGLFGQPTSGSGSGLFGSSGSGFGGGTTSSAGGFGSSPAFGKPAFGQSPAFGQTSSSPFGQPSSDSGGGGMFSGLGGKPSADKANTNVFGTPQTFGTSQQNMGLFGSASTGTFGSPQSAASSSGGGPFSSGGGLFSGAGGSGATTSGFGATASSGAGGFGSQPAFGAAPAFGSAPKFGTSPTFGGGGFGAAPVFGATSATFGSSTASTGGFANFAAAESPTFGALAQTSDIPTFGSLSGTGTGEGFGQTGGFGQSSGGFGQSAGGFGQPTSGFGSPSFGQQQSPPAFGGNTFGSSPSFTGYRG